MPESRIDAGANESPHSPGNKTTVAVSDFERVSTGDTLPGVNDGLRSTLSDFPSLAPSDSPSLSPSDLPSDSPFSTPSDLPSRLVSSAPSGVPNSWTSSTIHSNIPKTGLNLYPSSVPSDSPSLIPSYWDISVLPPSGNGAVFPSSELSDSPSLAPSITPRIALSSVPGDNPSVYPSSVPSDLPSLIPHSWALSSTPSDIPSGLPSDVPSTFPSSEPTTFLAQGGTRSSAPSDVPSLNPSSAPSGSLTPSDVPSYIPSSAPSGAPTFAISTKPSLIPSSSPIAAPSTAPSLEPTDVPSTVPSGSPSDAPTLTSSAVPSVVPSNLPSLMPSDAPSTVPSTKPSSRPSEFTSMMPSSGPSDILISIPSDVANSVPSVLPTDVSRGGFDTILDGGSDRSARTEDQEMKLWKTVGASAAVGSVLAILLVLLAMQRIRRTRSHTRELPIIVIPRSGASDDPYRGVLSDGSKIRADSTTSFALSSTINNLNSAMLPAKQLGIPIEVMDSMFDDVNSEMSLSSPTGIEFGINDDTFREIPEASGYCCANLGTNSEDAYVDALEDPSFGATNKALSDLMALEKDRSCESLSQNSSLKGLAFVASSNSKEVAKDATQEHPKRQSKRKEKNSPQQKDFKDRRSKTDGINNNNFDHERRMVNHMSDMELATTSNMMTPKRSNRSNNFGSNESSRRFFRNSVSPRFDKS